VIWTHLEARLGVSKIAQVLEYLVLLLTSLTHVHQILAQAREWAKVLRSFFKFFNRFLTQKSVVVNCSPRRRIFWDAHEKNLSILSKKLMRYGQILRPALVKHTEKKFDSGYYCSFFKDFIIKIIVNNLEETDSKENIQLRIIFNIDSCTSLLSHLFY
jgi:hypothetical protein